eukprot:624941_1
MATPTNHTIRKKIYPALIHECTGQITFASDEIHLNLPMIRNHRNGQCTLNHHQVQGIQHIWKIIQKIDHGGDSTWSEDHYNPISALIQPSMP